MSKKNLILTDLVFAFVVAFIYANDDISKHPLLLTPLISLAFASRIIGHINYYKLTKRIY